MNGREYALLSDISNGIYAYYFSLSEDEQAVFDDLEDRGWVSQDVLGNIDITSRGLARLLAEQEIIEKQRDEEAREEAEKQAANIQKVEDRKKDFREKLLVAAFTVVLTLLLEHVFDILQFLKNAVDAVSAH